MSSSQSQQQGRGVCWEWMNSFCRVMMTMMTMMMMHHVPHDHPTSSSSRRMRRRKRQWLPQLSSLSNLVLMRCARCFCPNLLYSVFYACIYSFWNLHSSHFASKPHKHTHTQETEEGTVFTKPICIVIPCLYLIPTFCVSYSESFRPLLMICRESLRRAPCPCRQEILTRIMPPVYWSIAVLKPLLWH